MTKSKFVNNPEVLKRLGNVYIRTGEYNLSSQTFEYLMTLDIKESDKNWVMFNMSIILRKTNLVEQAKKILYDLLKDDSKNPRYLCELGECYFDSKEHESAEKYFIESIKNINNAGCK